MSYAINMYFNQEAEETIVNLWEKLSLLNMGKCMSCANGRPHLTLAIYNDLDLGKAEGKLKALAEVTSIFQLKFIQVGIFPRNKGTIFLAPNLSDDLFHVHRHLHDSLRLWEEYGWDYYKPQAWYPHCTLSIETSIEEIPKVLEAILEDFQPIEAMIESMGIVSLEPIEYLCEIPLKRDARQ